MAAVRQGAYGYVHKTCRRYRLETLNKRRATTAGASSASAVCPPGDVGGAEPRGAEHAVTAGAARDGYTRVTALSAAVGHADGRHRRSEGDEHGRGSLRTSTLFGRCSRWGQPVFVRAYSGNGGQSEPLYKTKTGYYDILEVTPTATQAQIKTAYYKQSFLYHPDRNAGSEEATLRFSEISEAYTVLGNKALRKKYDRGLLTQADLVATARPSAKAGAGGSGKPHADKKRSVMGMDGRGSIFDFDKFYKAHYSEQLQRNRELKSRMELMKKKKAETMADTKADTMMELGIGFLLLLAMGILISLRSK